MWRSMRLALLKGGGVLVIDKFGVMGVIISPNGVGDISTVGNGVWVGGTSVAVGVAVVVCRAVAILC